MLISVHMPKAAGTTCLHLFEKMYGAKLVRDYEDKILHESKYLKRKDAIFSMSKNALNLSVYKNIECIHGHFMPLKYRFIYSEDTFFLTWFRHPVERLLSHYHYWTRETSFSKKETLRERFIREKWSLRRFCLGEEVRNIYSKFLWGFPLKRFNFIGITEFFEEDMNFLSREMFGSNQKFVSANINPDQRENSYSIDDRLKKEIEMFHRKDMVLYEHALALRLKRL